MLHVLRLRVPFTLMDAWYHTCEGARDRAPSGAS